MNRRNFLRSVPVLTVAAFVVSVFGRLFGREKVKPFSAGRLRREPELMGSWEDGPPAKVTITRQRKAYNADGTFTWVKVT